VKNPSDVVSVQQKVTVTVMAVDLARKRISLSMKSEPGKRPEPKPRADHPRKTRPTGNRPKPKTAPKPASPAPFNNPFADAFRKTSGR
jgi:uncharacterized protein